MIDKIDKPTARMAKNADNVNWLDISGVWDNPKKKDYTFVDLFCGAGWSSW